MKAKELNKLLCDVREERSRLMSERRRSRNHDEDDDYRFLCRLRELGSQTSLAREMGISRQTVAKRLARIQKETVSSADKVIAALQLLRNRELNF